MLSDSEDGETEQSFEPSQAPAAVPTVEPSDVRLESPTSAPSDVVTETPSAEPTESPADEPTTLLPTTTDEPTSISSTEAPTHDPSHEPSQAATEDPPAVLTADLTEELSHEPSSKPMPSESMVCEEGSSGVSADVCVMPPRTHTVLAPPLVQSRSVLHLPRGNVSAACDGSESETISSLQLQSDSLLDELEEVANDGAKRPGDTVVEEVMPSDEGDHFNSKKRPRLAGPSSMTSANEPTVAGSSPVHVHCARCRSRLSRRPDIRYQML